MPAILCQLIGLFIWISATTAGAETSWNQWLQKQLPLLGHRNWVVVVDAAYPLQTAPGIDTIYTDADPLTVVSGILALLSQARHVQPIVFTDSELAHVPEKHAPGITAYRTQLNRLLSGQDGQVLPHEKIISLLDAAGKTFKVLIIKTPLTLPYTSVFMRLECGYWNATAEKELRQAMPVETPPLNP